MHAFHSRIKTVKPRSNFCFVSHAFADKFMTELEKGHGFLCLHRQSVDCNLLNFSLIAFPSVKFKCAARAQHADLQQENLVFGVRPDTEDQEFVPSHCAQANCCKCWRSVILTTQFLQTLRYESVYTFSATPSTRLYSGFNLYLSHFWGKSRESY